MFGQMAVDTKVCGKMDVNMEKVYTVPETENLLNKDNGLMESKYSFFTYSLAWGWSLY